MSDINEILKLDKHPIWDVFEGCNTYEDFKNNIVKDIYIKPNVNEDIRNKTLIIQKLLQHSYFEYEFIDIAYNQAVSLLEKTMKIKYFEIHGRKTNLNLNKLIKWFFDNNYFETWNDLVIHQHRSIRNIQLHDTEPMLGGTVFLKKLYNVFQHINDLYEDVHLRIIRKENTLKLQSYLNDLIITDGGILTNNNRKIIHDISVIFLDNKLNDQILTIAISEIFDVGLYINKSTYNPPITIFELKKWEMENDKFTAITTDNITIIIEKNTKESNINKFQSWLKEMNSFQDRMALLNYNSAFLNDLFSECLTKLHIRQ